MMLANIDDTVRQNHRPHNRMHPSRTTFFLHKSGWIPIPFDWKASIVQGKQYELTTEPGLSLWNRLQSVTTITSARREERYPYGAPILTFPRLGQGSFRVLVSDAYDRRCAVTSERTLPALDGARIKPYSECGLHLVSTPNQPRSDT